MKKCPTCDKTFDDGMRFCQLDGTPLVEIAENASDDPFKTIVEIPPVQKNESLPFNEVSPSRESAAEGFDDFDSSSPKIQKFSEPSLNSPNFGDLSSSESSSKSERTDLDDPTLVSDTESSSASMPPRYEPPSSSPFTEPERTSGMQNDPFNQSPFEQSQTPFGQQSSPYNPPIQQTEWTPPPAPVSNWQDQGLGANTPFQPPVSAQGQDQTLAIVSLVTGILSILCCGPITGIPAIITGFMAKNNIDANPSQYTGRGMAIAGMIMGGISILFGILYIIYILLVGFPGRF